LVFVIEVYQEIEKKQVTRLLQRDHAARRLQFDEAIGASSKPASFGTIPSDSPNVFMVHATKNGFRHKS